MRGRKKDLLNLPCPAEQSGQTRGGEGYIATLVAALNMQILDVLKSSISWFIQISVLQYPEKYCAHLVHNYEQILYTFTFEICKQSKT